MIYKVKYSQFLKSDIGSGFVVFLVAIPLCLGIALASNAPLFSGLIAGVVGGIVVGLISKSSLSVSGPAAGLTAIVVSALNQLPSFETFLVSIVIAGVIQIILGIIKAGFLGEFVPNAVLKGMLAAVGIIIILKQVEILIGYDKNFIAENTLINKENLMYEYMNGINNIIPLAFIIGILGVGFLAFWDKKIIYRYRTMKLIPGGLIVVLLGVGLNKFSLAFFPEYSLEQAHLVTIPVAESFSDFSTFLVFPDFSMLWNSQVWFIGLTVALVASIETLLCIEGVDKLDPFKRITPTNRELVAQGTGNILSGLIGGLPITSVIVRSSANVNAGGKTKQSTIFHGLFLVVSILFLAPFINQIPLASLAAILVYTGYKLCDVNLIRYQIKRGKDQYYPFVVTIFAILLTDILIGVFIGLGVSVIMLLRATFLHTIVLKKEKEGKYTLKFLKDITFFNKGRLTHVLEKIPESSDLTIDQSLSHHIDKDIIDILEEYKKDAKKLGIKITIIPPEKLEEYTY